MANATPGKNIPGYETTFITRSELSDEALKTLVERIGQVSASFQGEVVLNEDWGKRKLAYSIKKETRGHYTYLVYTGAGDVVHEVERNLRLHDHVLRFLTVNLDKEFDPQEFKKKRSEIHAAAKRREEEREARKEERNGERRGYEDRGSRHEAMEEYEDLSADLTEGSEE
jgi:small subunit ribosomal protein S6